MTNEQMLEALGQLDEEWIDAAMKSKKKKTWLKWGSLAACLCLVAVAVVWHGFEKIPTDITGEIGYVWQWEHRTNGEKYSYLRFEGEEYAIRDTGRQVEATLLQEKLGQGTAYGYDVYGEKEKSRTVEVWEIGGIVTEKMVAVEIDGEYYVYHNAEIQAPETLGDLLELYSLAEHMTLSRFTREDDYFALEDDGFLWEVLAACADAPLEGSGMKKGESYLSFTATSAALGVYKRVIYVSEDGYLSTNILDIGCAYFIGTQAAQQIMAYAEDHSTKTKMEPYQQTLIGEVVEVSEDYILVDDSLTHWYGLGGKVYKVYLEDIRTKRYVLSGCISAGDLIRVKYEGYISGENEVFGAVDLQMCVRSGNSVMIPE